MCESDALVANEDAWSRNELESFVLSYSTERAVAEIFRFLKGNLAGHGLDYLMHSLVAQAEGFGDLPKAAPCCMESANGVLIVHLGAVGFELKLNNPIPGPAGFPQQRFIQRHSVYHGRRIPPGGQALSWRTLVEDSELPRPTECRRGTYGSGAA